MALSDIMGRTRRVGRKGPPAGWRLGGETYERGKRLTDKAQATENGKATATDTLTVTDNRTGESYDVEITDGTVNAMDFRQIKVNEDDFGLMTYDPGLSNTAHCRSSICYIGGEEGVLEYRGIPIGSASCLNPSKKSLMFSCTKVWWVTW